MRPLFLRFPERHRWPVALLAGAAFALAFPQPGWSGLAFLAPGVLAVAVAGLSPGQAFRTGYIAGLPVFLVGIRWLLDIPVAEGAVAAWLALSAYCAVYVGAWTWCFARLTGGLQRAAPPSEKESGTAAEPAEVRSTLQAWRAALSAWAHAPWWTRFSWSVRIAAAWVVLEMVRSWLLGGFPWNLLGTAFYRSLPLVQLAAWTGVYGVSFLAVWGSLALTSAILAIAFRQDTRWAWTAELRVPLLCLLAVGGVGMRRIMVGAPATGHVRMALVQPSIPQTLIWDPGAATNRFEQILALSRKAVAEPVDVLVWPEASLPDIDRAQFERMLELLKPSGARWVLGGDEVEGQGVDARIFNSAFLIGPDGRLQATYRKRRLVIFGEYVPLERYLPFMKYLTPIGGSFSEGAGPVPFALGPGKGMASPVICFEDVFPHGARTHVTAETDMLLELTNDGWFGEGSAQWQHLAAAVFRAVENGVPVVRCTNTGVTCWVDRHGRVQDVLIGAGATVYGAGYGVVDVPLGTQKASTFYRERGDWFGGLCWGVWLLGEVGMWRRKGKGGREEGVEMSENAKENGEKGRES